VELARLGLAACDGRDLDVVVGGLGLGCTARAALEDRRVRRLQVVERLPTVVGWHERRLLPESPALVDDARCALVVGDFFALVADGAPFGHEPGQVDAVLLDVDHSPRHVLHPSHAALYTAAGLRRLADRLRPGGVFALWSDDPPDAPFLAELDAVFAAAAAHVVAFPNPLTAGESTNTVYVATTGRPLR
jgi:spermidine synthase